MLMRQSLDSFKCKVSDLLVVIMCFIAATAVTQVSVSPGSWEHIVRLRPLIVKCLEDGVIWPADCLTH